MSAQNVISNIDGQLPDNLINLEVFLTNLVLATAMALVLAIVYKRFSPVISDRSNLARTFFMLSTVTLTIITVVKSSLALSLGLVGALSIIRFRSAIKDPEELTFIFLAMGVGLGLGANQREVIVTSFIFIVVVYIIRALFKSKTEQQCYHVVLSRKSGDSVLKQSQEILKKHCQLVNLKRIDSNSEYSEVTYSVEIKDIAALEAIEEECIACEPIIDISFLDLKGLVR